MGSRMERSLTLGLPPAPRNDLQVVDFRRFFRQEHRMTPDPAAEQLRRHRRAQGISQLELACRSGVSQRHISAVESGRARAGREVIRKLARALRLPLAESNRLLLAAGYSAAYPKRRLDDAAMLPVREALQRQLAHHEPYPACVSDRAGHLILANEGFNRVLSLVGEPEQLWRASGGPGVRNLLLLTLHPQGIRPYLENAAEIVPALLARAATEAAADPEAARILAIARALPGLPRASDWPDHDGSPVLCERYRIGSRRLHLFAVLSCFGTPMDETTDRLRIESFFPADAESEAVLEQLATSP